MSPERNGAIDRDLIGRGAKNPRRGDIDHNNSRADGEVRDQSIPQSRTIIPYRVQLPVVFHLGVMTLLS